MTESSHNRIITLTGRAPVTIRAAEWPVIATASGDSYSGDPGRYRQALQQGGIDTYSMHVRRHADGRVIVYGVLDAAIGPWRAPAGGRSRRAGIVLSKDAASKPHGIPDAIRRIAHELWLTSTSLADDCIADLPPEEI